MNLNSVVAVVNIVFENPTFACISLGLMAAGVILMWLMVRSSGEFTVEDTEANAGELAGKIKESQCPVTTWLWVAYAVLIIWQ